MTSGTGNKGIKQHGSFRTEKITITNRNNTTSDKTSISGFKLSDLDGDNLENLKKYFKNSHGRIKAVGKTIDSSENVKSPALQIYASHLKYRPLRFLASQFFNFHLPQRRKDQAKGGVFFVKEFLFQKYEKNTDQEKNAFWSEIQTKISDEKIKKNLTRTDGKQGIQAQDFEKFLDAAEAVNNQSNTAKPVIENAHPPGDHAKHISRFHFDPKNTVVNSGIPATNQEGDLRPLLDTASEPGGQGSPPASPRSPAPKTPTVTESLDPGVEKIESQEGDPGSTESISPKVDLIKEPEKEIEQPLPTPPTGGTLVPKKKNTTPPALNVDQNLKINDDPKKGNGQTESLPAPAALNTTETTETPVLQSEPSLESSPPETPLNTNPTEDTTSQSGDLRSIPAPVPTIVTASLDQGGEKIELQTQEGKGPTESISPKVDLIKEPEKEIEQPLPTPPTGGTLVPKKKNTTPPALNVDQNLKINDDPKKGNGQTESLPPPVTQNTTETTETPVLQSEPSLESSPPKTPQNTNLESTQDTASEPGDQGSPPASPRSPAPTPSVTESLGQGGGETESKEGEKPTGGTTELPKDLKLESNPQDTNPTEDTASGPGGQPVPTDPHTLTDTESLGQGGVETESKEGKGSTESIQTEVGDLDSKGQEKKVESSSPSPTGGDFEQDQDLAAVITPDTGENASLPGNQKLKVETSDPNKDKEPESVPAPVTQNSTEMTELESVPSLESSPGITEAAKLNPPQGTGVEPGGQPVPTNPQTPTDAKGKHNTRDKKRSAIPNKLLQTEIKRDSSKENSSKEKKNTTPPTPSVNAQNSSSLSPDGQEIARNIDNVLGIIKTSEPSVEEGDTGSTKSISIESEDPTQNPVDPRPEQKNTTSKSTPVTPEEGGQHHIERSKTLNKSPNGGIIDVKNLPHNRAYLTNPTFDLFSEDAQKNRALDIHRELSAIQFPLDFLPGETKEDRELHKSTFRQAIQRDAQKKETRGLTKKIKSLVKIKKKEPTLKILNEINTLYTKWKEAIQSNNKQEAENLKQEAAKHFQEISKRVGEGGPKAAKDKKTVDFTLHTKNLRTMQKVTASSLEKSRGGDSGSSTSVEKSPTKPTLGRIHASRSLTSSPTRNGSTTSKLGRSHTEKKGDRPGAKLEVSDDKSDSQTEKTEKKVHFKANSSGKKNLSSLPTITINSASPEQKTDNTTDSYEKVPPVTPNKSREIRRHTDQKKNKKGVDSVPPLNLSFLTPSQSLVGPQVDNAIVSSLPASTPSTPKGDQNRVKENQEEVIPTTPLEGGVTSDQGDLMLKNTHPTQNPIENPKPKTTDLPTLSSPENDNQDGTDSSLIKITLPTLQSPEPEMTESVIPLNVGSPENELVIDLSNITPPTEESMRFSIPPSPRLQKPVPVEIVLKADPNQMEKESFSKDTDIVVSDPAQSLVPTPPVMKASEENTLTDEQKKQGLLGKVSSDDEHGTQKNLAWYTWLLNKIEIKKPGNEIRDTDVEGHLKDFNKHVKNYKSNDTEKTQALKDILIAYALNAQIKKAEKTKGEDFIQQHLSVLRAKMDDRLVKELQLTTLKPNIAFLFLQDEISSTSWTESTVSTNNIPTEPPITQNPGSNPEQSSSPSPTEGGQDLNVSLQENQNLKTVTGDPKKGENEKTESVLPLAAQNPTKTVEPELESQPSLESSPLPPPQDTTLNPPQDTASEAVGQTVPPTPLSGTESLDQGGEKIELQTQDDKGSTENLIVEPPKEQNPGSNPQDTNPPQDTVSKSLTVPIVLTNPPTPSVPASLGQVVEEIKSQEDDKNLPTEEPILTEEQKKHPLLSSLEARTNAYSKLDKKINSTVKTKSEELSYNGQQWKDEKKSISIASLTSHTETVNTLIATLTTPENTQVLETFMKSERVKNIPEDKKFNFLIDLLYAYAYTYAYHDAEIPRDANVVIDEIQKALNKSQFTSAALPKDDSPAYITMGKVITGLSTSLSEKESTQTRSFRTPQKEKSNANGSFLTPNPTRQTGPTTPKSNQNPNRKSSNPEKKKESKTKEYGEKITKAAEKGQKIVEQLEQYIKILDELSAENDQNIEKKSLVETCVTHVNELLKIKISPDSTSKKPEAIESLFKRLGTIEKKLSLKLTPFASFETIAEPQKSENTQQNRQIDWLAAWYQGQTDTLEEAVEAIKNDTNLKSLWLKEREDLINAWMIRKLKANATVLQNLDTTSGTENTGAQNLERVNIKKEVKEILAWFMRHPPGKKDKSMFFEAISDLAKNTNNQDLLSEIKMPSEDAAHLEFRLNLLFSWYHATNLSFTEVMAKIESDLSKQEKSYPSDWLMKKLEKEIKAFKKKPPQKAQSPSNPPPMIQGILTWFVENPLTPKNLKDHHRLSHAITKLGRHYQGNFPVSFSGTEAEKDLFVRCVLSWHQGQHTSIQKALTNTQTNLVKTINNLGEKSSQTLIVKALENNHSALASLYAEVTTSATTMEEAIEIAKKNQWLQGIDQNSLNEAMVQVLKKKPSLLPSWDEASSLKGFITQITENQILSTMSQEQKKILVVTVLERRLRAEVKALAKATQTKEKTTESHTEKNASEEKITQIMTWLMQNPPTEQEHQRHIMKTMWRLGKIPGLAQPEYLQTKKTVSKFSKTGEPILEAQDLFWRDCFCSWKMGNANDFRTGVFSLESALQAKITFENPPDRAKHPVNALVAEYLKKILEAMTTPENFYPFGNGGSELKDKPLEKKYFRIASAQLTRLKIMSWMRIYNEKYLSTTFNQTEEKEDTEKLHYESLLPGLFSKITFSESEKKQSLEILSAIATGENPKIEMTQHQEIKKKMKDLQEAKRLEKNLEEEKHSEITTKLYQEIKQLIAPPKKSNESSQQPSKGLAPTTKARSSSTSKPTGQKSVPGLNISNTTPSSADAQKKSALPFTSPRPTSPRAPQISLQPKKKNNTFPKTYNNKTKDIQRDLDFIFDQTRRLKEQEQEAFKPSIPELSYVGPTHVFAPFLTALEEGKEETLNVTLENKTNQQKVTLSLTEEQKRSLKQQGGVLFLNPGIYGNTLGGAYIFTPHVFQSQAFSKEGTPGTVYLGGNTMFCHKAFGYNNSSPQSFFQEFSKMDANGMNTLVNSSQNVGLFTSNTVHFSLDADANGITAPNFFATSPTQYVEIATAWEMGPYGRHPKLVNSAERTDTMRTLITKHNRVTDHEVTKTEKTPLNSGNAASKKPSAPQKNKMMIDELKKRLAKIEVEREKARLAKEASEKKKIS